MLKFNPTTSQFDQIGVEDDDIYRNFQASGVIEGGILSIDTDPAKFDVSAGRGVIVDSWTDVDVPVRYEVTWNAFNAQTVTNLATETVTNVFIDRNGAIHQQTAAPDGETRRDYLYLGSLAHTNNTSISTVINRQDLYVSPVQQFRDLEEALGVINNGIRVSPNGANLKLNRTTGTLYSNGINFAANPKEPSVKSFASATAFTFRYRTQTGAGASTSDIDPTKYDVAGTITSLTGTKSTNQRVFITVAGNMVVQYGQVEYAHFEDALADAASESFTIFPNLEEGAVLLAVITIQSNCTDLTDTTRCVITPASKLGELGAGGGSTGGGTTDSGYRLADTEYTSTYVYVGYEHESDGSWYIYRRTRSTNLREYATGTSNYATNWTNRASLTYA